jgi:origin recognition complex subunit 1
MRRAMLMRQARAALTLACTPRTMPCREEERGKVSKFLRDSVASGDDCLGRCLYIYGVPGTGKTATVLEVVRQLYDEVATGELPCFQFVEVNGLRLPSPGHAYTALWEALTGSHASPSRAADLLENYFSSSQRTRQVTVLLVDELDLLVTRNQSVLYNLFDWPTRKHSRLVVVGIANTMDLPERLLPRINSRLGLHRVNFQPYAQEQLQQIIKARLSGLAAFKDKAVELASRKVAAVSGDVRRALELYASCHAAPSALNHGGY